MVGSSLFITKDNTIYVADLYKIAIYKLFETKVNKTIIPLTASPSNRNIFVTDDGSVYVSPVDKNKLEKWSSYALEHRSVIYMTKFCQGLFIDIANYLYCSTSSQVVKFSLDNGTNSSMVVAGKERSGSGPDMLNEVYGIFVDTNFNLYVADCGNNRIQLFTHGQLNGTTVAGMPTTSNIKLDRPTAVFVDADAYLFIVDQQSHRIIGSNVYGFYCLAGCLRESGQAPDQLSQPGYAAFDSYGNVYVADTSNSRIQKFNLMKNTTDTCTTTQSVYLSNLTANSSTMALSFCTDSTHFYEAIEINVIENGLYRINIETDMHVYSAIYKSSFNSSDPSKNLLQESYATQVKLMTHLRANITYVFIVATSPQATLSTYQILMFGPNYAIFNRLNISSIVQSVFSFSLTEDNPKRLSTRNKSHYYQAIDIQVFQTGQYIFFGDSMITINGYIYNDTSFNPFNMNINSMGNFGDVCLYYKVSKLNIHLHVNTRYLLVVTTLNPNVLGNYSIVISGRNAINLNPIIISWVESIYSSKLSENSMVFSRTGYLQLYYYEAIEVKVIQSGAYILRSNSTIDMYGIIYRDAFVPSDATINLYKENDNSYSDNQFQLNIFLDANSQYVLVVTTSLPKQMGYFSIVASGPNNVTWNRINVPYVFQSIYNSTFTSLSPKYAYIGCDGLYYYESIEVIVRQTGNYVFSSDENIRICGYIYNDTFNPTNPVQNLIYERNRDCLIGWFRLASNLSSNTRYILVVRTPDLNTKGNFSVIVFGPNFVNFAHIKEPVILETFYSSELTRNNPTYARECGSSNYYYETVRIEVKSNGNYSFGSLGINGTFGYIYRDSFDSLNPTQNLLSSNAAMCGIYSFQIIIHLQVNITYILVVTTLYPNVKGNFSIHATGPYNISLTRMTTTDSVCMIGDRCHFYLKPIGFTLEDILREEIQVNVILTEQSVLIKISIGITTFMFVAGLINSVFSLLTFRDDNLRKVGCGIYLLASSITSLLTISMFTVKFWYTILTPITGLVSSAGCIIIEPLLKLFVYSDAWLNVCVAVERTVAVSQGVRFNKIKSRYVARRIVVFLPLFVLITIIHEPIYRDLFQYQTEQNRVHTWCITRYSTYVQNYNTFILFFHLIAPFIINLFSALFIIFGSARQRSLTQKAKNYKEHVQQQFDEHKQLIVSPIILLILASPRLIIALISGCKKASDNPWLYLSAYFVSFTSSMLIFVVFILPSKLYRKTFMNLFRKRQQRQRN